MIKVDKARPAIRCRGAANEGWPLHRSPLQKHMNTSWLPRTVMAHRSRKSWGGRCRHIRSVAIPYSMIDKIFNRSSANRKKKCLPSALNVPLPSITLAHHPDEHGTASTPLQDPELSKLLPKALELLRVVWSLSADERNGFLPVLDRLDVLSSGLRQSPSSPLERHLKQRFTAPVLRPQTK